MSTNITERMKALSREQESTVELAWVSAALTNARDCEKLALEMCVNKIEGEWFNCTKEHAIKCAESSINIKGIFGESDDDKNTYDDLHVIELRTTSLQELLEVNRRNVTAVSELLGVNRATIRKVIDSDRKHVVLINEDGSYKLLK